MPARHSGVRGLGDYARRGAAGYVLRSQGTTLYFAGDTGYFSGFAEIGRRFNPDVALLPIGGYEPAGFRDEHMSPLDAIYAFEDLGARVLIPIAHGSFPLSYEPLEAPTAWLRQLARPAGLKFSTLGDDNRRRVSCFEQQRDLRVSAALILFDGGDAGGGHRRCRRRTVSAARPRHR